MSCFFFVLFFFFFQAEDGIRDLVRSRGLGDVYKRQIDYYLHQLPDVTVSNARKRLHLVAPQDGADKALVYNCLLYTSDAADERSSVDLGGRRIIKKKKLAHAHNDTGGPLHRNN